MMMRRTFFGLGLLALMTLPALAVLNDDADASAHVGARDVLLRTFGGRTQTVFTSTNERVFSTSEILVSGDGYFMNGDVWAGRYFTYSAKVRRNTFEVRDVEVRLENGQTLRGNNNASPITPPYYADITTPSKYSRLGQRIEVAGTAWGRRVRLVVRDSGNRMVDDASVTIRNSRFSHSFRLQPGVYRVSAYTEQANIVADEVRFSVDRVNRDWGIRGLPNQGGGSTGGGGGSTGGWGGGDWQDIDDTYVTIDTPGDRARVGSPVKIEGRSRAGAVRVECIDRNGRTVFSVRTNVNRGRWSAEARLNGGTYTLRVTDSTNRDRDERTFIVR